MMQVWTEMSRVKGIKREIIKVWHLMLKKYQHAGPLGALFISDKSIQQRGYIKRNISRRALGTGIMIGRELKRYSNNDSRSRR